MTDYLNENAPFIKTNYSIYILPTSSLISVICGSWSVTFDLLSTLAESIQLVALLNVRIC